MVLYPAGKTSDYKELDPVFVDVGPFKVAVYLFQGKFYAYADRCPHQGGPACEGLTASRVRGEVSDGRLLRTYPDAATPNIVCPWHAYEFDLQTGRCQGNPRIGLLKLQVVTEEDRVHVKM